MLEMISVSCWQTKSHQPQEESGASVCAGKSPWTSGKNGFWRVNFPQSPMFEKPRAWRAHLFLVAADAEQPVLGFFVFHQFRAGAFIDNPAAV